MSASVFMVVTVVAGEFVPPRMAMAGLILAVFGIFVTIYSERRLWRIVGPLCILIGGGLWIGSHRACNDAQDTEYRQDFHAVAER